MRSFSRDLSLAALLCALGASVEATPQIGVSADRSSQSTFAAASAHGVTASDVGDVDSFGRDAHWLGSLFSGIALQSDCSGLSSPCQLLLAAPASTSFEFKDIAHISLPADSAHSLFCYWISPTLTVSYGNATAAAVVARMEFTPYFTLENPVLLAPGLIDPSTGMPMNGKLLADIDSHQRFEMPLPAGTHIRERKRDSAVCQAGLVSHDVLVNVYGLSRDQAEAFFKVPTTIRLNVDGNAQYVDSAILNIGLRIIGD